MPPPTRGLLISPPEFAETYSLAERVRFALTGVVVGAIALAAWKWWALPSITRFADTAPCRTVFGIGGASVLWDGLFVGLPLLCAVVFAIGFGRPALAILRDGQYPPRGVKGFRPIRIRRGTVARWIGYLHLLACVPFIAIAVWGYGPAAALSHMTGTARCSNPPQGHVPPARGDRKAIVP